MRITEFPFAVAYEFLCVSELSVQAQRIPQATNARAQIIFVEIYPGYVEVKVFVACVDFKCLVEEIYRFIQMTIFS